MKFFVFTFGLLLIGTALSASPSAEELIGRTQAYEKYQARKWEQDRKAALARAEAEFQANKGRSFLSAKSVAEMSQKLGIQIGHAYIQAPRKTKTTWDNNSSTGKQSVVVTDAGIYCIGAGIGMNCYYDNGSYFKSFSDEPEI